MKIKIEELREKASKGVAGTPREMDETVCEGDSNLEGFTAWRIDVCVDGVGVAEVHGWTAEGGFVRVSNREEVAANAALIAHCLNTNQMLLDALNHANDILLDEFGVSSEIVGGAIEAASFVEVSK